MAKKFVILFAILAVALPIVAHIRNVAPEDSLTVAIFPALGLLAFTLLWLHSISGAFEKQLRERFKPAPYDPEGIRSGFDAFVHWTSITILISMLLHPLLLLIIIKFNFSMLFMGGWPIRLGIIGLILLLTYDIAKPFKKSDFFARHWNTVLIVSTIGFILIFFHSLKLGSDLQIGFMHYLWLFYGTTGILATIYTYGIKRFLK
ncbi:hypothetical protein KW807_00440 [Candidatus Parcubacteria bacterium]|nr:hypothetical protein [Candidatus Parcubacteria bacterium]